MNCKLLQSDYRCIVKGFLSSLVDTFTQLHLFATDAHHDTEIDGCDQNGCTTSGYERKRLTGNGSETDGNEHGYESLTGDHECESHGHEHSRHIVITTGYIACAEEDSEVDKD